MARKLPKAERRDQLLDTALALIAEEGTDALTLGYLAERAGVSKPVAYDHFQSRAGLLIALYERLDDQQIAAMRTALAQAPRRLEAVAGIVSRAYMACYGEAGTQWHAISAALKGDEQMEAFQQRLLDRCVALYGEAFAPCTSLPADELRLRCIGILGAAEAIARDMVKGAIGEERAAATLTSLILAWLAA